ncbi:MAG: NAD(P)-binding domain-containing protein, partial [Acidimicrobiia bacterium]|nr:NAD(P)-binding domain-containing protein [Acidimicrobiia bacterium]
MTDTAIPTYDLAVIGASHFGMSLAEDAADAGIGKVVVVESNDRTWPRPLIPHARLDVYVHAPIRHIGRHPAGGLTLTADDVCLLARAVVIAELPEGEPRRPGFRVPETLSSRVHDRLGPWATSADDVLVIGNGESAVESVHRLAELGASVVLVMPSSRADTLSRISRSVVDQLEHDRKITIFWHSQVSAIDILDGHPMVTFVDRMTPDLQFDHVLFELGDDLTGDPLVALGLSVDEDACPDVAIMRDRAVVWPGQPGVRVVDAGTAWLALAPTLAPDWIPPPAPSHEERADALRERHYNAAITYLDTAHSDLWILRVRPDHENTSHLAGQYATLGLGYWEPRADAGAPPPEDKRDKLIRRSYSISSPMFDRHGYLVDAHRSDELEFYIVLVPTSDDRLPDLTPRLALKRPGDRIFLGPKVAGRYTLDAVTDPKSTVLFLSTGTGEAPHNAMIIELLRKGHQGTIVSAVSVRHRSDLGYLSAHRRLEERYANYTYLPLPTREPDTEKLYIQDLIRSGRLDEMT